MCINMVDNVEEEKRRLRYTGNNKSRLLFCCSGTRKIMAVIKSVINYCTDNVKEEELLSKREHGVKHAVILKSPYCCSESF